MNKELQNELLEDILKRKELNDVSIDFETGVAAYEEHLEEALAKTKDLKEIESDLYDNIHQFAEDAVNIYDWDLKEDAMLKINSFIEFSKTSGIEAKNAFNLLQIGEYTILEEVLYEYHNERVKDLEIKLSDKANQMEM